MSEFDIVQAYYDLSSDEGPTFGDLVSTTEWEVVKVEVRDWLVRSC